MKRKIGFWEAYSIGIGGMIGGGIFAVLGITISLAKGGAPFAFIFAGIIALFTSYSYAKLSVRYPSEGGTVEYLIRAFGNNLFISYLNTLLVANYVIMLSLYSYAFGSYASAALFIGYELELAKKLFIIFIITIFTVINALGAYISGKVEDTMVFAKIAILLLFFALGFLTGDFSRLSPAKWGNTLEILTGGLIIFLAYEGFELIANTAQDVKYPERTLPKAFYSAVITVIIVYVAVSAVAVANLSYEDVQRYQDYALAVAAKPFLGKTGFVLIGIAALLSTASAINATLYGSARVSYLVAKFGALPKNLTQNIWKHGTEGLFILAISTVVFATTFDLKNISVAGSLGFLVIFAGVNLANSKVAYYTDSNKWISLAGFILCVASAVVLISYNLQASPSNLTSSFSILSLTLLFEILYRVFTTVRLNKSIDWKLEEGERFLDNYTSYVPLISKAIKKRFEDAEIYLTGNLATKNREKSGHLNITLLTKREWNNIDKEEKELKKKLNLEDHHPLHLEIVRKHEELPKNKKQIH